MPWRMAERRWGDAQLLSPQQISNFLSLSGRVSFSALKDVVDALIGFSKIPGIGCGWKYSSFIHDLNC